MPREKKGRKGNSNKEKPFSRNEGNKSEIIKTFAQGKII